MAKAITATESINLNSKQAALLRQVEDELDLITNVLSRMGIDFDYDYGIIPEGLRPYDLPFTYEMDDDDDIPSHLRYQ